MSVVSVTNKRYVKHRVLNYAKTFPREVGGRKIRVTRAGQGSGGETNGFGEKSPRIATQGTQLADLGCTPALLLRHLAPISSA